MEDMVEAMTVPYLTISEAAEKTRRSESTVRRVIHSIAKEKHPDRGLLQPSIGEVKEFKKKGENFTWKIAEEVLLRNLQRVQEQEKKKTTPFSSNVDVEILAMLKHELEQKSKHIEKQWEVIASLNERLREGNILMGTLQKRLAIPEASTPSESVLEAVTLKPSPPDRRAGAEASVKPPKKASKMPSTGASKKASMEASTHTSSSKKKRGFFAWFSGN